MSDALELEELRPSHLEDLARFYAAQGPGARAPERGDPVAHLRWYLFENPAAREDLPKGWIARTANGQIAGAKYCSPQRFRYGEAEFTLLLGGGYYVAAGHRGLGLLLMRRYLALGDRYSHFATTMNEVSGALYERYGGYAIPGTDHELLGVLRWPPLVEEVLVRRLGNARLKGAARVAAAAAALRPAAIRGAARGALTPVASPEDAARLAADLPPQHQAQLTGLRDRDFLRWRYFDGPDTTRALFLYEAEEGACLVGVNRRRRGHRGQIRALTLLDLWGRLPAARTPDVARALAASCGSDADLIVCRGLPPDRERALQESGFVFRALPRAVGVCIDRAGRLPTRDWYLVPADGDMGH